MTKFIRIFLFIAWIIISPIIILGVGFAGPQAFNPVRLLDDILSADVEGVLARLTLYFVVVFPFYLVFYLISLEKQGPSQDKLH